MSPLVTRVAAHLLLLVGAPCLLVSDGAGDVVSEDRHFYRSSCSWSEEPPLRVLPRGVSTPIEAVQLPVYVGPLQPPLAHRQLVLRPHHLALNLRHLLLQIPEHLLQRPVQLRLPPESVNFTVQPGVVEVRHGVVNKELHLAVALEVPPHLRCHVLEVPRIPPYVYWDGATFMALPPGAGDMYSSRAIHDVGRDRDTWSAARFDVVGVWDVHWVEGVAVGVVGDEAHWCFIGEDGDVLNVGHVVVHCFVVDFCWYR